MKKIIKIIAMFSICLFWGCESSMDKHQEFMEGGSIVYLQKNDSTSLLPGKDRFKLRLWYNNGQTLVKTHIYYNDRADTVVLDLDLKPGLDSVSIYIDAIENNYNLELVNFNKFDQSSLPISEFVTTYGEKYHEALFNRGVKSLVPFSNKINWYFTSDGYHSLELEYLDQHSEMQIIEVDRENETILADIHPDEKTFRWRTAYVPEEDAIDIFYTEWEESSLEKIIVFPESMNQTPSVPYTIGTTTVTFESLRNWRTDVSQTGAWCSLSVESGDIGENQTFNIEVVENETDQPREATITIIAGANEEEEIIKITQLPRFPMLENGDNKFYVYDRNCGDDVPSVVDEPLPNNYGKVGGSENGDIRYRGDYYTWREATAVDGDGKSTVCPTGWRVPTKTEMEAVVASARIHTPIIDVKKGVVTIVGVNGGQCFLPMSGWEGDPRNDCYYWITEEIRYLQIHTNWGPTDWGIKSGLNHTHKVSVRCVKSVATKYLLFD